MPRSNSVSGGRRLSRSRNLAEHRGFARLHDQHSRRSAAHAGAHEHAVGAFRQAGFGRDSPRLLLHREGFAGEHGLVDKEVVGLQHDTVGWDQAARGEQHHIARHDLFGRQQLRLATAQHVGFDGDLRPQFLDGIAGPVFLHEAEHRAAEHHGQHDGGIGPLPHEGGDNGGKDEDQHKRAFELAQEQTHRGSFPPCLKRVQPVSL